MGDNYGEITLKKKRVMTYFIESTEKLMREEGTAALTIRRISADAGYNSATLYNYFEDLEHLILFASVHYLRDYVSRLAEAVNKKSMNALEKYRTVYEVFSDVCFSNPDIFYNMFFGKYRDKLDEVVEQYYTVFPDELASHSGPVLAMLKQGDIFKRDLAFMPALVAEGFVAEEKMIPTVNLIVRAHQTFIYDAWTQGEARNKEQLIEEFMQLFDYIMEAAR